jgi:hypothetical protein
VNKEQIIERKMKEKKIRHENKEKEKGLEEEDATEMQPERIHFYVYGYPHANSRAY